MIDQFQQQPGHRRPDAVLGEVGGVNPAAGRIHTQMQFAPGTPFRSAMRAHLPFAFPIDFQPRAVHDNIHMPAHLVRQLDLQGFRATR